jgi:hypothetical protein
MVMSYTSSGLSRFKVGFFMKQQIPIIVKVMRSVVQMVSVVLTTLQCVVVCMDLYQKFQVNGTRQIGQVVALERLHQIVLEMSFVKSQV